MLLVRSPKIKEVVRLQRMKRNGLVVLWLRTWCEREVVQLDERLTSKMAERAMLEGDLRRADRKAKRDAVAAAILLQSWLESGQPGA